MDATDPAATKIELIALDLDGTLLTGEKRITSVCADILADARRTGAKVVLATARPPRSVEAFYRQLDLQTPAIYYNGALVYDPSGHQVLLHRPIPADIAAGVVRLARQRCPEILVSGEIMDRWCTDRVDDRYLVESARLAGPDTIAPIEHWLTEPLTKLLLLGEPEKVAALAEQIARSFPHQVAMVRTEGFGLQIMHATVSKVQALRTVAAELGVQREAILAIGDNVNDVEMLRWAGVGVAVANAAEPALEAADFVTRADNDHDAVAEAVRQLVLRPLARPRGRRG
jgi:hypothetical protein